MGNQGSNENDRNNTDPNPGQVNPNPGQGIDPSNQAGPGADKLATRSLATQVSIQKTDEISRLSKAFFDKYCTRVETPQKFLITPNDLQGRTAPDESYKSNALLSRYLQLRKAETKIASLPYQPGALEAVHKEIGAIQEQMKDPKALNDAFMHISYLLRFSLIAPMANTENLTDAAKESGYKYQNYAADYEADLFGRVDEEKIAEAEEYLDLLYNVSFEEDEETNSLKENDKVAQYYRDTMKIIQSYREMTEGRLYVPGKDVEKEDGVPVHRVSNVTVSPDGTRTVKEPEFNKSYDTPEKLREGERKYHEKHPDQKLSVSISYKEHKGPMFFHEPCPEDVKQGSLGDCYMISALQAISSQCPDFIKDSMTQNKDGTVTVRFFNDKSEPVFVTVSDTIPYRKEIATDLQGNVIGEGEAPLYAARSHWVGILEKAFAVADLPNLADRGSKKGNGKAVSYEDIDGGTAYKFIQSFMGPHLDKFELKQMKAGGDLVGRDTHLIEYDGYGEPYSNEELSLFDDIESDVRENRIITCAKKSSPAESERNVNAYELSKGLPGQHAYSVIDVKTDDEGTCFVKILDPNRARVRTYENRRAKLDSNPEYEGESLVELHEFFNKFHRVHSIDPTNSIANQKRFLDTDEYKRVYGEPIRQLCKEILSQDDFLHHLGNSRQYNQLLRSADAALKEFDSRKPSKEKIQTTLTDLFDKAEKYLNYRNTRPKSEKNEQKPVSASRYFAAEALVNIKGIFEFNQNQPIQNCETIDAHDILEETLHSPLNRNNNAQMAARQYQYLRRMKTDAIQAIRKDNGKHSIANAPDREFKLNKDHLVNLVYANVMQNSFSKASISEMNRKLNPDIAVPEKTAVAESLNKVMPFLSMDKMEKMVFSPDAENRLYTHYLEGLKAYNKVKPAERKSESISRGPVSPANNSPDSGSPASGR